MLHFIEGLNSLVIAIITAAVVAGSSSPVYADLLVSTGHNSSVLRFNDVTGGFIDAFVAAVYE
jgi:hypothetical protein